MFKFRKRLAILSLSIATILCTNDTKAQNWEEDSEIILFADINEIQNEFRDVNEKSNNYKSIHFLRDLQVINGYEDNTYKPQNQITKRQAALLISRLEDHGYIELKPLVGRAPIYTSFGMDDETYFALNDLYRAGMIEFDIEQLEIILFNNPLTRGEMAKILVIAFELPISKNKSSFKDVTDKSLIPYVETLKEYGITTGYDDGTFRPDKPLSRAHYAEFIYRSMKYNDNSDSVYVDQSKKYTNDNMLPSLQRNWANTVLSFISNENNVFTTVDVLTKKAVTTTGEDYTYTTYYEMPAEVIISTYTNDYKSITRKKLDEELPLFGTFYAGKQYNYIAYGQKNMEEDNNKEVIRIVKYDKEFNRLDALSIKGGDIETTIPFDASTGRMAESDGQLIFHTSRERYTADDGLNHQSQITFIIDTNAMRVVNETPLFPKNHVSHSFNQFVLAKGDEHILLDHGDAYPRALVVHKGNKFGLMYAEKEVVKIPGRIGENMTGIAVGGFDEGADNYLIAYNEVARNDEFPLGISYHERDIKVATVSKDLSTVNLETISQYTSSEKRASIPLIVKVAVDEFIILWQEYELGKIDFQWKYYDPVTLKYAKINGDGQLISDIKTKKNMYLSYMQPIYKDGTIHWYVNNNNNKHFFALDVNDL